MDSGHDSVLRTWGFSHLGGLFEGQVLPQRHN